MRLTLLKAKEALASHASPDIIEDRINRSIERIILDGKYMGGMDRIALLCLFGDITLPRQYRTVEGVKVDTAGDGNYLVRPLTNSWYEFLEGKQTLADVDRSGWGSDTVRSLGDGHAIIHDLPLGGTLTTAATVGAPYRIVVYGRDMNGMPIQVTLTDIDPTVVNNFIRIERVHHDQTPFVVRLQQISSVIPPVTTDLAWIEPTEEETYYRRYRDDSMTGVATANVLAYVKRRHIETTSDEDVLAITNITALGMEMDSLQYLAENDVSLSGQYHAEALAVLNAELKDSHSADEIPTLKFHFPGGVPLLTSHY